MRPARFLKVLATASLQCIDSQMNGGNKGIVGCMPAAGQARRDFEERMQHGDCKLWHAACR